MNASGGFGALLRDWRNRRRMSQLELALAAETSTRHLSFLETGRARPSRGMVLNLASALGVPMRQTNLMLGAAGFAALYDERGLDDPALAAARQAIDLVLAAQEPWPALAVDRSWNMVARNRAVAPMLKYASAELLVEPINVLRLSLHPDGLAPKIVNYADWRSHVLHRLRASAEAGADPALDALHAELDALPAPYRPGGATTPADYGGVVVPLVLETGIGRIAMFSTTTTFGTPLDVTLEEIAVESFFPADPASAERMRHIFETVTAPQVEASLPRGSGGDAGIRTLDTP